MQYACGPHSPTGFEHKHARKVSALPIAAVSTKHVEVLALEGAVAAQVPIDLAVVVEQRHALLGQLLA